MRWIHNIHIPKYLRMITQRGKSPGIVERLSQMALGTDSPENIQKKLVGQGELQLDDIPHASFM